MHEIITEMKLHVKIFAIFLTFVSHLIVKTLGKDDGGIRMEIDITGLTPQNGIWEPDIYMKLSSPQYAVVLCNVKILGMNNRKIPCDIPVKYIKQGHNEYHVTIYSSKSGKIFAHMDASFDTTDEDEMEITGMPSHASAFESIRKSYQNPILFVVALSTCTFGAKYLNDIGVMAFFANSPSLPSPPVSHFCASVPTSSPASRIDNPVPEIETQKPYSASHISLWSANKTASQFQSKAAGTTFIHPTGSKKPLQKTNMFSHLGRSIVGMGLVATGLILNDRRELSQVETSSIYTPSKSMSHSRPQSELLFQNRDLDSSHFSTQRHSEDASRNREFDASHSSTLRVLTKSIWNLLRHGKLREPDNSS